MAAFTPVGVEAVVKNLNGFNRDLNKMNSSISNAGKAATDASGDFGGFSSSLSNVATLAAGAVVAGIAAATAAVVGLGASSVKAAIEYESAFAGVLKTTDGLTDSTGELNAAGEELRQGFIDLSKEIPISANTLANIGELGGQLGIGRDNLLDFTETIAQLGVTTNLTTDDAAQQFAQLANIMGTSQEDFDRMASSVVGLGNNFATTERDIVNFASRIAGAGAIAGLTEADIFGISAAMSSVGIEAEAGGTAVQKVLLSMNEAVTTTTTGFVNNTVAIGKTEQKISDLRTQLQVATLRQGEFTEKTKESTRVANQARIDKLTRQIGEQEMALTDLVNSHGQLAGAGKELETFAATAGLSVDEFTRLYEEDAGQAFQLFVEGLQTAGDDAIGVLDELGLRDQRLTRAFLSLAGAGDLLGESIQQSTQDWNENIAASNEAEQRFGTTESKIQLLKNTFDALKIAIGTPFLDVLQTLTDAFRGFVDDNAVKVEQFFTNISEAISKFVENINTGIDPLTNFQALLSRVLQAFGVDQSDALSFAISFREAFEGVVQFWNETLKPAFDQIVIFLKENIPVAMDTLKGFWEDTLKPALEGIGQTIEEDILPAIGQIVTSFGELKGWWDVNGPVVTELINGFVQGIESGLGTLSETVLPFLVEQFEKISAWWVENGPLMTPIIEGVATAFTGMESSFSTAWAIMEPLLSSMVDKLLGIGETVLKIIDGDWAGAWESAKETTSTSQEGISESIQAIIDEIPGLEEEITAAEESWSGTWELIGTALNTAAEKIGEGLSEMATGIEEFFSGVISGAAQFVLDLIAEVQGVAEDIKGAFEDTDWESVGDAIITGVTDGIKNNAAKLNDEIRALAKRAFESAKEALGISSPSKVFMEIGEAMADGMTIGFRKESENTLEAIEDMLNAARNISNLFVKEFERQTFGPLEKRSEQITRNMERFTRELSEAFGRELEESEIRDLISQATQQEAGLFDFGLTPEQLIAINRVIDIRKANAQLTKEEEEAQERLLQIERQRQQLGFLQEQLKLLELIRDAGLDPAEILGGLELGLDADVSGLLAATAAATQALIDQAEADLGIGSPSKVFMDIGRNVMAGLAGGIQSAIQFPRQAVAQAAQMMTPQATTVNNNTQNVSITANVTNGMDLAGFEAAANRALGGGAFIQ